MEIDQEDDARRQQMWANCRWYRQMTSMQSSSESSATFYICIIARAPQLFVVSSPVSSSSSGGFAASSVDQQNGKWLARSSRLILPGRPCMYSTYTFTGTQCSKWQNGSALGVHSAHSSRELPDLRTFNCVIVRKVEHGTRFGNMLRKSDGNNLGSTLLTSLLINSSSASRWNPSPSSN